MFSLGSHSQKLPLLDSCQVSKYPKISKGLGKLTPALWGRLMGMLSWYESKSNRELSNQTGFHRPQFLAKFTASAAIGGASNRYTYSFTEVVLDTSNGVTARTGGQTGTTALNLCEMSNDANNVAPAVDMNGAAYPSGFTMRAIGSCIDSVQVEVVVMMYNLRDADGNLRQVFALANAHDGTCS